MAAEACAQPQPDYVGLGALGLQGTAVEHARVSLAADGCTGAGQWLACACEELHAELAYLTL